jgi:hypothetical protein
LAGRAAAIAWAAMLAWSSAPAPALAQAVPACAPASDPICRTIASAAFAAAFRDAASGGIDPEDAVDDVRANLRRAMLGGGQEAPGAIGRQVDAVLDDALGRAQRRMCGAGAAPAVAVAAGFSAAAAEHGTRLGNAMLGAMTGAVVGAAGERGAACLCAARSFDALRRSCARR